MTQMITFPGLGLEFELNRVAVELFGRPIYWYGVIIACGFLLAVWFCYTRAPKFGIRPDDLIDLLFFAVPLAIVGARLYYIIFYLDHFRATDGSLDFAAMVRIWDGGLAIYGAVIVSFFTLAVFCRVKKLSLFAFADLGVYGLLIGQCIGRWGNFVNVEAFGGETDLPWRMGVEVYGQYMEVHPTFLYESVWNLIGLILLMIVAKKWRKFDGQIMLGYFLWYGFGRGLIEGLRTDSLYFFETGLRVSQVFGFATALVAALLLVYHLVCRKHTPDELYVNRVKINTECGEGEDEHGGEHH